jgi:mannose-1-phosphate guanylyltransferase/mannose-6-phosphate isomerase
MNRPTTASDEPAIQVCPVILAGGSGTRLWPLSRARHPKQFLALHGERSLFEQAALRLNALAAGDITVQAPCVIGNEEHRFLILDQLQALRPGEAATVVLEPVGRNTAPAMTLAALHAMNDGSDPVLVVSPADQTVADEPAFTLALQRAIRQAADGGIVILGVRPDRPETGYGYVRSAADRGDGAPARVVQFVEKPDLPTAQHYLDEGRYYWNSGMFVLRASVWLAALADHRGDIHAATHAAWQARTTDKRFVRPGGAEFAAVPAESVDHAVMEKVASAEATIPELTMVVLEAGWSDLGAWDAVWQVGDKDTLGNASSGDTLVRDSRNTLVHATSRLVGVVGLDDVVVVETPDAVLVTDRRHSQDVKLIVAALQRDDRAEHTLPRQVHRPWGWYDSVDAGSRFQVKRIMVKPGAALSLQMHHHRAEHWIVVSGTAEVTCGDKKMLLTENQSTYIPLGEVHRLANPGTIPLEIIEVQSGSYLGEDDIVRFEDTYGRTP